MLFLFVLDNLRDNCGATVNIAITMAKQLIDNGHKVYAVTCHGRKEDISSDKKKSFSDVFCALTYEEDDREEFMNRYNWNELGYIRKALLYLLHPYMVKCFIMVYRGTYPYYAGKLKKKIEEIAWKLQIDSIIAYSFPHYTETAVTYSKTKSVKALFQTDPYIHHQKANPFEVEKRKKEELRILCKIDKVFTTPIIYNEYLNCFDEKIMEKIIPVEFPGIKMHIQKNYDNSQHTNEGTVHFYFVGHLYSSIRNPKFTFNLFCMLPSNYILHVVGDGCEDIIKDYRGILGDRLILHGSVSNEKAEEMIYNADVLININNTVSNQVPSKIFDYINTGRPIINICKLQECPSLPYMNRYPLCFNIFEYDRITDNLINRFKRFIDQSVYKVVPHDEIISRYYECTDEYVARQIMSVMN